MIASLWVKKPTGLRGDSNKVLDVWFTNVAILLSESTTVGFIDCDRAIDRNETPDRRLISLFLYMSLAESSLKDVSTFQIVSCSRAGRLRVAALIEKVSLCLSSWVMCMWLRTVNVAEGLTSMNKVLSNSKLPVEIED